MSNSSEVSYLRSSDQLETTKYPEPSEISAVYAATAKAMSELLQGMFDAVDDSLFELANNARSNNEQNRFFEAMRDVRIKKQTIETALQKNIKALFEPKTVLSSNQEVQEESLFGKDNLALVGESEMELDIAMTSMSSKASANFQGQLIEIKAGFGTLYHAKQPQLIAYPLEPRRICKAFCDACSCLEVDLKEHLLILKQFDRYVMAHFDEILTRCGSAFAHLGIVFSNGRNKTTVKSSGDRGEQTAAKQKRASGHRQSAQNANDMLPALQALLAKANQTANAQQSDHINPKQLSSRSIQQLLNAIQKNSIEELQRPGPGNLPIDASIAQKFASNKAQLNKYDADLINLVSMLFDFILKDYSLAPSMQALISRLQIPIVKVVMQDKTFFNSSSHPARHLLNTLAKAGIGWSESTDKTKDPLYAKIYQIVYRVLEEFDGDIRLFADLSDELDNFLLQEERKSALIEQRTREAEEGRIKSRRAQIKVEETLSKQILSAHHYIPDLVINMLKNGWSRVMFLAYLKDAEEHQWQNVTDISKELIWCLQPLTEARDRQRWITVVPKLLKDLEAGLRSVSYSSSNLEETMLAIKDELTSSFKESSYTQPSSRKDSLTSRIINRGRDEDKLSDNEPEQRTPDSGRLKAYLARVSELKPGQWVEFRLMNGSQYRCKLSAHIPEADSYIFVNRMGLKPMEKTREELAKDLLHQRVVFLDQGLIIDRALSSIMSNLRQDANNA